MCIARKHAEYLERTNEEDYQAKRVSFETYYRFKDIVERCEDCALCGNGEQGDTRIECRFMLARAFAALKGDAEKRINERWIKEADEDSVAQALEPHLAPLPPSDPAGD